MSRVALRLLLSVMGCAHQGAQWPKRSLEDEVLHPQGEQPMIAMERHGCFGSCPAYRIEGFADGRVEYFGIAYVALHGERTYRVPSENIRHAAELLARTSFRSDPEWMDGGLIDEMEFYLFDLLPRPKFVRYYRMAPSGVDVSDAARQIDALLSTDRWVRPPQKKP